MWLIHDVQCRARNRISGKRSVGFIGFSMEWGIGSARGWRIEWHGFMIEGKEIYCGDFCGLGKHLEQERKRSYLAFLSMNCWFLNFYWCKENTVHIFLRYNFKKTNIFFPSSCSIHPSTISFYSFKYSESYFLYGTVTQKNKEKHPERDRKWALPFTAFFPQ